MTGQRFKPGDTVQVRSNHPEVVLHGKVGEVLGYTDSARYARVRFTPSRVELLLDSEMEPVTECEACGGVDPDCASCEAVTGV